MNHKLAKRHAMLSPVQRRWARRQANGEINGLSQEHRNAVMKSTHSKSIESANGGAGALCGRLLQSLIVVAAGLLPVLAQADQGVRALRVHCSAESGRIEIEPFIAWDRGGSPYPQFGAEEASAAPVLVSGAELFYSMREDQQSLYAECTTKTRVLRIFVTREQEITIVERGRAIAEALPLGDAWGIWPAIYILRSNQAGTWEECYGPKSAGYGHLKCARFDIARPNNKFMSESSIAK